MSDLFQKSLWIAAVSVTYIVVHVGLGYLIRRRSRLRGIQFPRDVPDGPQACSVCHLQTSELVDGKCPDHDAYQLFDRPCLWTPPEIKHDGPATSHMVAYCASKFDQELVWLRKRDGTCTACDRKAPLVDGECPDCRH